MATDRVGDAPASAGSPYLIHTFEHRAYPLTPERTLSIGRDIETDIVVNEVSVSRRHLEIRCEGGDYVVHALGSTPTLVNDMPMAVPHVLHEGDTILVGTMRFVFTRERLPVAVAVAAAPSRTPLVTSSIDDRRPTLTFARQDQGERKRGHRWGLVWLVVLVLIVVIAYWVSQTL